MISCQLYDHIEIVCMYHYPITLTLKDGQQIQGDARDTTRNAEGDECIKIATMGAARLVILDHIETLTVNIDNPHFTLVNFD